MSAPLRIGLLGKARAGKDTFGWALCDALRQSGVDARLYSFAAALKAICRVEFGMVEKDGPFLQDTGVAYRDGDRAFDRGYNAGLATLAEMGYEVPVRCRKYTPDIWLNTALAQVAEDAPEVAIFTDVRFPNEAAAMARLYRVVRTDRDPSGRDDAHISEVALDATPATMIANEKSVGHLHDLASQVAAEIFKEVRA